MLTPKCFRHVFFIRYGVLGFNKYLKYPDDDVIWHRQPFKEIGSGLLKLVLISILDRIKKSPKSCKFAHNDCANELLYLVGLVSRE